MSRTWDFLNQLNEAEQSGQSIEALAQEYLKIALEEAALDHAVNDILKYFGRTLGGDRVYIFEKNAIGRDDNTYEWTANDVEPEKESLQNLPEEIFESWYEAFLQGYAALQVPDIEALHKSDVMKYAILKVQHIKDLSAAPICIDEEVVGFLGIDNPTKVSLTEASRQVQIMAELVSALFKHRDMSEEGARRNYMDTLTGLGNRYAMEDFIGGLYKEQSIGVVFCDVTGLKRMNDTIGAEAGDQMLLRVCESLKEVFEAGALFRIGGDEFVVLRQECGQAALQGDVDKLRLVLKKHEVTAAVGAVWRPDCTDDVRELIMEAEQEMFADKAAYYHKRN